MRWAFVLTALLLLACQTPSSTAPSPSVEPTGDTALLHTATPIPASCPVTKALPPNDVPPGASEPIRMGSSTGQWTPSMVGNSVLWSVISPDGTNARDDKILTVTMVDGLTAASAHRVDGSAATATVSGPNGPKGPGVRGLQVFGITYSAPGCWEVTQQLAGESLQYVVWVRS
jgi:hypothetical protein